MIDLVYYDIALSIAIVLEQINKHLIVGPSNSGPFSISQPHHTWNLLEGASPERYCQHTWKGTTFSYTHSFLTIIHTTSARQNWCRPRNILSNESADTHYYSLRRTSRSGYLTCTKKTCFRETGVTLTVAWFKSIRKMLLLSGTYIFTARRDGLRPS